MVKWVLLIVGGAFVFGGCVVQHASSSRLDTNALFAGEIHNYTGVDILAHEVQVDFLDKSGNVIQSATVIPCLRSLQSGSSEFFEAQSNDPTLLLAAGRARLAGDPAPTFGHVLRGSLTLSGARASQTGGLVTVNAVASNSSAEGVSTPKACAIAKDARGDVLRVAVAPISPAGSGGVGVGSVDLAPGASRGFSLTFSLPNGVTSVGELDLYADGLQNSIPMTPTSVQHLTIAR
ncbi:MAG: hypothetical protein IVW36_03850 [Dehalococcoidia bacterium]|nr:hypothetical protein [Dehalococcoidia bacterium]